MANSGMLQEIQATRAELARLNADLARLGTNGAQGGRTFGQKFKAAALSGVKEVAKGMAFGLGERLSTMLFSKGDKAGKSYGRGFKKSAKKEIEAVVAQIPAASGARFNLAALPIIGAGVLAATIASQVGSALQSAFEQESALIALDALAPGQGKALFSEMRADALRTGQEVDSLTKSLIKMIGLGFAPEEALKMSDAVLDLAGGLGMTAAEADLVVNAISQIKGKGKAAMEELRGQLGERAVPILSEIKARYGEDWEAMVTKGQVSVEEILSIFSNLEGALSKFQGGADRAGSSAPGLFARLKQEAIDLKRVFGEGLLDELKLALSDGINLIRSMKDEASAFGAKMGEVIGYIRAGFKALSPVEMFVLASLKFKQGLWAAIDLAQRGVYAIVKTLSGDEFQNALTRAAYIFKAIMMAVAAEVADALAIGAESLPGGKKNRMAVGFKNAAHYARGTETLAVAQYEATPRNDNVDYGKQFNDNFKAAPKLFQLAPVQLRRIAELEKRIREQEAADQKAFQESQPGAAPATGTTTPTAKKGIDPTGMLAGGLANAISRITGGGDILMTKQLSAQESTAKAAEATAKTVAANTKVLEQIALNTNPRNRRGNVGGAVLVG